MGTTTSEDIISTLRGMHGLVGVRTVAGLLNLKVSTVYKLVRLGQIPHFRVGYAVRLDPAAIASWLLTKQVAR